MLVAVADLEVLEAGMFVPRGIAVVLLDQIWITVDTWHTEAPAALLLGMAASMSVPMVASSALRRSEDSHAPVAG